MFAVDGSLSLDDVTTSIELDSVSLSIELEAVDSVEFDDLSLLSLEFDGQALSIDELSLEFWSTSQADAPLLVPLSEPRLAPVAPPPEQLIDEEGAPEPPPPSASSTLELVDLEDDDDLDDLIRSASASNSDYEPSLDGLDSLGADLDPEEGGSDSDFDASLSLDGGDVSIDPAKSAPSRELAASVADVALEPDRAPIKDLPAPPAPAAEDDSLDLDPSVADLSLELDPSPVSLSLDLEQPTEEASLDLDPDLLDAEAPPDLAGLDVIGDGIDPIGGGFSHSSDISAQFEHSVADISIKLDRALAEAARLFGDEDSSSGTADSLGVSDEWAASTEQLPTMEEEDQARTIGFDPVENVAGAQTAKLDAISRTDRWHTVEGESVADEAGELSIELDHPEDRSTVSASVPTVPVQVGPAASPTRRDHDDVLVAPRIVEIGEERPPSPSFAVALTQRMPGLWDERALPAAADQGPRPRQPKESLETLAVEDSPVDPSDIEQAEAPDLEQEPADPVPGGEIAPGLLSPLDLDLEEDLLLADGEHESTSFSSLVSLEEASVTELGPRALIELSRRVEEAPSVADVLPSSYSLDPDLDELVSRRLPLVPALGSDPEIELDLPGVLDPDEEPTVDGLGPMSQGELALDLLSAGPALSSPRPVARSRRRRRARGQASAQGGPIGAVWFEVDAPGPPIGGTHEAFWFDVGDPGRGLPAPGGGGPPPEGGSSEARALEEEQPLPPAPRDGSAAVAELDEVEEVRLELDPTPTPALELTLEDPLDGGTAADLLAEGGAVRIELGLGTDAPLSRDLARRGVGVGPAEPVASSTGRSDVNLDGRSTDLKALVRIRAGGSVLGREEQATAADQVVLGGIDGAESRGSLSVDDWLGGLEIGEASIEGAPGPAHPEAGRALSSSSKDRP